MNAISDALIMGYAFRAALPTSAWPPAMVGTVVTNLAAVLLCVTVPAFAQSGPYPRALLRGDYPDPSILRDGSDYYMTHSPFVCTPCFLIWHSRDFMNWEPVARAMTDVVGSAMAPDLVKHNGKFYIYFPAAGVNWVIWADNICGPWSEPIRLNVGEIDPGHAVGEDGRRYLFLSAGHRIGLSDDGLAVTGQKEKVYSGWECPKEWKTEGSYEVQAEVTVEQGGSGGLVLFYNEKAFAGISSDGQHFTICITATESSQQPSQFGRHLFLKIVNRRNTCDLLASADGKTWTTVQAGMDVSQMHHYKCKGFFALRPGLMAAGSGEVKFNQFRYENIK